MLYIITELYKIDNWLHIQQRYLEKFTQDDFTVLLGYDNIDKPINLPNNYQTYNLHNIENQHYLQANYLCDNVLLPNINDDDIIVFLDIDAFPCNYWVDTIKQYLQDNDIAAIYRYEDKGFFQTDEHYPSPHLSFFATTKKTWKQYRLRWNIDGGLENPQFGMQNIISNNNLKIKEMLRTNVFDAHRIMFGVYDNIIYHHCCGIRGLTTKNAYEGGDLFFRSSLIHNSPFNDSGTLLKDIIDVNTQIFYVVYNAIKKDESCEFINRYFIGKQSNN